MRISDWSSDVCSSDLSGERAGPIYKTVMVQANGAQAAGSAQSYAIKQFMRGQFMIPTGDADDPDKISVDISAQGHSETDLQKQIGRASCRARVCQSV